MTLLSPLSGTLSPLGVAAGRRRGVQSEYCLGFDGVNQWSRDGFANQPQGNSPVTVTAWVKFLRAIGSLEVVAFFGNDSSGQAYFLYRNSAGRAVSEFGSGTGAATSGTTLPNGVWHHLASVYDGSTNKIYVNGRLESSVAFSTANFSQHDHAVGAYFHFPEPGPGAMLQGSVDDHRIYSRALTDNEISAIYVNTTPPPTDGLVAYFPLDEGTGTTTTDTVAGLVGTLTGGPTWQPQTPPRLIAGRNTEEWSVAHDGTDDHVTCGNLNISGTFTISAWVKQTAEPSVPAAIAGSRGPVDYGINFGLTGGNLFWSDVGSGSGWIQSSNNFSCTYSLNTWHHVALVVTTTGSEAFLNGRSLGTSTWSGTPILSNSTHTFVIGSLGTNGGRYWSGNIKDVRIYNSALPAASIGTLARAKEPSETPVARWRLNEGSGTTAADSIGSNHGTLTNGPVWTGDVPQHFRQTIESSQSGNFDGVDDDVLIPTSASQTLSSAGTVSAWVNVNSLSGVQRVFTHGQATILFMEVRINEFRFYLYDGTYKSVFSLLAPVVGSWYHLAVKFDSTTLEAFVNGISQGTVSAGPIAYDPGTDKRTIIGANVTVPFHWINGLIDEFGHYNRALSVAEVADQAAGYLVPAGLVSRYKLDNSAVDSVGTNHGTENGGVGYSTDTPGTL